MKILSQIGNSVLKLGDSLETESSIFDSELLFHEEQGVKFTILIEELVVNFNQMQVLFGCECDSRVVGTLIVENYESFLVE